jgi:predicted PhzF superfamily epimerase YddE/YHI9
VEPGTLEAFVVDAFTERAFGGNPAGVVLLDGPRDAAWMQDVAAELKHAETAFTEPPDDAGVRALRWFTPVTEVDLCGHATLATAHVLGGSQRFSTRSGVLTCRADGSAAHGRVEMDFPADPPVPVPAAGDSGLRPQLSAALPGVTIRAVARGVSDVLVEAASAAEVRSLRPDFPAITAVPGRGVIVTAPADLGPRADFVSRCFYPSAGIPEDPVTGSAHCTLACWWSERLGRGQLTGEQASPRGGLVRVTVRGDRVALAGRAVTVLRGTLLA